MLLLAQEVTLPLTADLLHCNPHYVIAGNSGFLQAESRVSGGDYRDSQCGFTLALIDYNGDGVYNQPGVDRLALTIYQDRILRINNGYGTPCMTLRETDPVIFIDSIGYAVTGIAEDGKSVLLRQADVNLMPMADLKIETRVPDATVATFVSPKLQLGHYFHQGKSVYLYFFNSRPLEYQKKRLDVIQAKYSNEVTVIGLYLPFSEPLDQPVGDDLLLRMANPWPMGICELALYQRLQQDMSYYRGVWADEQGNIQEISISPKELLAKLEALFGVR